MTGGWSITSARPASCAGPKKSIYPYVFPTRNPARRAEGRDGARRLLLHRHVHAAQSQRLSRRALGGRLRADRGGEGAARADLAYALVRPPGHHAETRTFGGFCYFNNAAIAANMLLALRPRRRSSTSTITTATASRRSSTTRSDVLTVSIHGHPSFAYPYFTGFRDETGIGPGAGYNLNIPLPEHITPEQHRNAVAEACAASARFAPAFLVVSARLRHRREAIRPVHGPNRATRLRAARPHDRRAGLLDARGAGGRLPRAHARRQCGTSSQAWSPAMLPRAQMAPALSAERRPASGPQRDGLEWRSAVMADDVGRVRSLVASTGFFNAAEVDVAADLVTERLTKGIRSGYHFILAERGSGLVAYACYGPIEGTQGSFELYWIAVAPDEQRKGLGLAGIRPRRDADAQSRRQADLCRYLLVRPLCRHARLLSAHGLSPRMRGCRISTGPATARSSM